MLNKYNTCKQMSHLERFNMLVFVVERHGGSGSKISYPVAGTNVEAPFQYREKF